VTRSRASGRFPDEQVTLGAEEIRRAIGQSKVSQDRAIGIARKTDLADQAPSSMNCGSASYTAAKAVNIDLNQVINPICDL